jgi:hypothetical protein
MAEMGQWHNDFDGRAKQFISVVQQFLFLLWLLHSRSLLKDLNQGIG